MNTFYPSDTQIMLLISIHKKDTLRTMRTKIGKSLRWVQLMMEELEQNGYVINPYLENGIRKKTARTLTSRAIETLRKQGLYREPK